MFEISRPGVEYKPKSLVLYRRCDGGAALGTGASAAALHYDTRADGALA